MTRARRRLFLATALPFAVAGLIAVLLVPRKERSSASGPPTLTAPPIPPGSRAPQLVLAWSFGALLDPEGELWLWGHPPFVGAGARPDPLVPHRACPGTNWTRIAGSGQHLALVRDDGTLWGMGGNYQGQLAQPAAGWFPPVPMSAATNWVDVAAPEGYTLAVNAEGDLWYAGGTPPTPGGASAAPGLTEIPGTRRWAAVVAGWTTACVVGRDGVLFPLALTGARPSVGTPVHGTNLLWKTVGPIGSSPFVGLDTHGRLLTGSRAGSAFLPYANTPADSTGYLFVPGAEDSLWARLVTTPNGLVAQRRDGSWWGLDLNQCGQLGLGDRVRRHHLTRLPWPAETLAVAGNYNTIAALLADGSLWYAGQQLGGTWAEPANPGVKVHRMLSNLGAALDLPGAGTSPLPMTPVPRWIWTWPGPRRAESPSPAAASKAEVRHPPESHPP